MATRQLTPLHVPELLRPLLPTVAKYSVDCDDELLNLRDRIYDENGEAMRELKALRKAFNPAAEAAFEKWSGDTAYSDSSELWAFARVLELIDSLGINVRSRKRDPIRDALKELKTLDGVGAAAIRRSGAQHLAEMGPEAAEAIPALREALNDRDDFVRAWVHAAIARIESSTHEHRAHIESIVKKYASKRGAPETVEGALSILTEPQRKLDQRRLISAAILDDCATIRVLAPKVEVDFRDLDGQRALELALGNDHFSAVRELLQAGADVNDVDKNGDRPLHNCACRLGWTPPMIIRLLLKFGADPTMRNREGLTPLELAKECKVKGTIAALENWNVRR